jgi:hypothetical protein
MESQNQTAGQFPEASSSVNTPFIPLSDNVDYEDEPDDSPRDTFGKK